jgi:uncharacterized membrane protein
MEAIDLIKVHPPMVHFAIALPVALLVIDLIFAKIFSCVLPSFRVRAMTLWS